MNSAFLFVGQLPTGSINVFTAAFTHSSGYAMVFEVGNKPVSLNQL